MFRLSQPSPAVLTLSASITDGLSTRQEKAVAIFNWMREEIAFGFTGDFDEATPDETLRSRRGHCNPQGALFASLLNAAGIPAKQHFVKIDNKILDGVFPPNAGPPGIIAHSWVDVQVEPPPPPGDEELADGTSSSGGGGRWVAVDGYIVDSPLRLPALKALRDATGGPTVGYGVHRDGVAEWDGASDCFIQFADPAMKLEECGAYDCPADFYRSPACPQRLGFALRLLMRLALAPAANARLNRMRAGGPGAFAR